MNRLARVLLILVSLLLAVVVVVAGILIYTVRRPFPKTNGNITVTGLQAEVNIYRDEYGIPHIYAQNADDLFFAEGYVHAQDRFWQME
ncbi:MAG: penicillin acylase family protein, partial [Anaerolineales bacterium]|nr:penicillin acylase family protein [Anaerolineales bacterium]